MFLNEKMPNIYTYTIKKYKYKKTSYGKLVLIKTINIY